VVLPEGGSCWNGGPGTGGGRPGSGQKLAWAVPAGPPGGKRMGSWGTTASGASRSSPASRPARPVQRGAPGGPRTQTREPVGAGARGGRSLARRRAAWHRFARVLDVDRLMTHLSPVVAWVLRSPLHVLASWGLALLHVTGRRTGRR